MSSKPSDFIETALVRFKLAAEAESENRRDSEDDVEFRIGKQWPSELQTQRTIDSRPCLVLNRLPQFIRQVTNEYRQQRPSIQVNPVGSGSDVETAEILQGIIRHIELNSDAEIAYDTAFEQMVTCGFGYFRVLTDYADDESDEQEIIIERIANQFTVYFDPAAVKPDKSDAKWCFIVSDVPFNEYKQDYNGQLAQYDGKELSSIGDQSPGWASNVDGVWMVRVAEYFYVETEKNEKGRDKRKVKWAKINALETLEETDWIGKYIPVVPVIGDEIEINGKKHIAGLVRDMKDPQRMYNYWNSKATEAIALAPLAPFIVAEGQIEGRETEWSQANVRMMSVLQYKPTSVNGTPVDPPQRQTYEPAIQAVTQMIMQTADQMKAIAGIYDPSLGAGTQDQSGKAILARQKQSDVANLNFSDNAARSLRYAGRVILDLIPKIYDVPRIQRIIKPDGSSDSAAIFNSQNPQTPNHQAVQQIEEFQGIKKIYDIGLGRYDVTVSVGPSYQSKRQEAVAAQLEFLKLLPPELQSIFMDLVTSNMDWPQAKEFAERAKKVVEMLHPGLIDNDQGDPTQQIQQLNAKLQAISQQHAQLTQVVQQQQQVIETKQVEQQAKIQQTQMQESTRLEIAKMQEATKLAVAQINASKDANQAFAENEIEQYRIMHDSAHEQAMATQQHEQAKELAAQQAVHQSQLADQNAANQMVSQEQGAGNQ